MDQLDEEPDEAHDGETNGSGNCDLLEFCKRSIQGLVDILCNRVILSLKIEVYSFIIMFYEIIEILVSL